MNPYLQQIHKELGITDKHIGQCKLRPFEQAELSRLEVVDIDFDGRPFILSKQATEPWRKMRESAKNEGIRLDPYSGFRSYIHQKQLIARKLGGGKALEIILTETAIPGFSEHHTGCAIDLCTDGDYRLEQDFEKTDAFGWLMRNADRFGFRMSYPRNNPMGIIFEPWHWFFVDQNY